MKLGDCCDVTDDSMLNYSWNVLQFKASESAAGGAEEELNSSLPVVGDDENKGSAVGEMRRTSVILY